MGRLIALFCACAMAWGAEDGWQKVRDLKTGAEIRVFKNGEIKPISAKAAGATDHKLLITVKNAEVAIDKAEIDHIDFRPPRGKPVKTETSTTTTDGFGTNSSWSSGTSWGRDGWQTVYQKHSGK